MKRMIFTALFCFLLAAPSARTQTEPNYGGASISRQNLTCSPAPCRLPNTRVSQGNKTIGTASNLAIDPLDSLQMILGLQDSSCASSGAAYRSNDGGTTWTKTCLPVVSDIDLIGAAWMSYDNSGTVHALLGTFNLDDGDSQILETHSTDNGATWSAVNPVFSVQFATLDSQAIDDNSSSPFAGSIYGSVTEYLPFNQVQITVRRSNDGGATWSATVAATLPKTLGLNSEGFSHLALGKDGTVYLGYMATRNGAFSANNMMFTRSDDGGQTWSKPVQVYAARAVSMIPNTDIFIGDAPVLAVDNSPAGQNRLYMTFYNWTGTFMQVLITHSPDGGNTWSPPVPVTPASDTHDQFQPYVSVSSAGSVAITWLDRRDDPANVNYRTYAAISRNGTFSNGALATVSSTPLFGTGPAVSAWQGSTLLTAWPDTRPNGEALQQFIGGYQRQ